MMPQALQQVPDLRLDGHRHLRPVSTQVGRETRTDRRARLTVALFSFLGPRELGRGTLWFLIHGGRARVFNTWLFDTWVFQYM
jgi:hypothetical protein